MKTPEEARGKVDEIVAKGADFVKVWIDAQGGRYPKLTPEFTEAVMDQARKHKKIRMAHIVELADARRMVAQGVDILVHNVRDQDLPDDFIATLKARNVSVISTLAREEALFVFGAFPSGPAFTGDPFFKKGLSAERLDLLRTRMRDEQANDPARPRWLKMFDTDKPVRHRRHVAQVAAQRLDHRAARWRMRRRTGPHLRRQPRRHHGRGEGDLDLGAVDHQVR